MKQKIPLKIYLRVAVGFVFSSIIIWYFAFKLLTPLLAQTGSLVFTIIVPIALSILLCSLLVKRTIKIELETIDEPFTIVARDPNVEIPKEKFTVKILVIRLLVSCIVAFLITLPFTIISIVKTLNSSPFESKRLMACLSDFKGFYIFFAIFSIFAVFVIYPSLKKWQWTKHQFR